MFVKVIQENVSKLDKTIELFLANVTKTVECKYRNGANGIDQVLVCTNLEHANSKSIAKSNYGRLGVLQFNLTHRGKLIPLNETKSKLRWASREKHLLIDIKNDKYEILGLNDLAQTNNDSFEGHVILRSVKESNIVPDVTPDFSGSYEYSFIVRDFNSATDSTDVHRF